MKEIVVINGSGGSGKSTFVSFVKKYSSVYEISSVERIKQAATLLGWNGEKTEKDRKFLSDLKFLTSAYNDLSFNIILDEIKNFLESNYEILFIHMREIEEIKRLKSMYDITTLLIKNNSIKPILSNEADKNVYNYNYDIVIENNSLKQLEEEAKKFALKSLN